MSDKKTGNWFMRHKVLTVIAAIIVIAIIASASSSNKSSTNTASKSPASTNSTTTSTTSTTKAKTASTIAKIGQPASDGKFSFTVNTVKCGIPSVSDSSGYLSKTAQGQYCDVNITVKNIGNEAQTLDSSSQYLFNAADQKYSADSSASLYANPTDSTFLNSINPGNSATGDFIFDLPKDQTPVTAELHDSAFSGGVKVSLQ